MKNFIVAIVSVYLTIVGVLAGLIGMVQYVINWLKKLGCVDELYTMLDKKTRKDLFKTVGLCILSWPYWVGKGLIKGIKGLKAALNDETVQKTVIEAVNKIKEDLNKNDDKEETSEEKPEEESEDDEF